MKYVFGLALVLLCLPAISQESATPTTYYKTVVQTNWIKPDTNWRSVNGVTYHTIHSTLWGQPLKLKHLEGYNLYGNHVNYYLQVNCLIGNTVFCDILKRQRSPQQWADGGINDDSSPELVSQIMILNYPSPEDLVSGSGISCQCMKTTNYLAAEHKSFEAYDCGIQVTNFVPIIVSKRVKMTNSVASR